MSPGPSQGPAHTGTAGLSQPTGTSSPPKGEGPTTHGAQLKLGITDTDNNGTGILRPPRLLYNGAKPLRSQGGYPQTHPIPTQTNLNSGTTTRYYTNSPGALQVQTQTLSQSRREHSPTHHTPTSRYKTLYCPGTLY